MRNKLFATAKEVVSFFGFVAVLFLFVAAAGNGTLSASTTPQISAGLQTSPPPFSPSLRGTDGCPPLAGVGGGFSGDSPEHFDSISRIEPATGKSVGWVERSETQQSSLSSASIGDPQLDKAAFAQKTKKLRIPFIANNGQVDERVKFYAKTFGGTVFVTKDGEIVYALPNNSSEVETQCLASSMHSPNGRHNAEARIQDNSGSCIVDCASVENRTSDVVHPVSCIVAQDSKSEFRNPQSAIQNLKSGVALREEFVGSRIKTIHGEDPSVTKVNYFKGNDPEKWKTNVSTYDYVNLGEIYKGIELRLKAYGDNVEKLFCVKSGANTEQIKITLSGIQPSENPPPLSPSVRGTGGCPPLAGAGGGLGARGLWVNEEGQLVAETELGPVKFTKPIAYQEIDGKRVEVDVEYSIQNPEVRRQKQEARGKRQISGREKGMWRNGKYLTSNLQPPTSNPKSAIQNLSPTSIVDPKLDYGFKVASYDKTKDLIIDPLLASTYLGGSNADNGYSLALYSNGLKIQC